MTIQPLSNPAREISVTEIIEPAYERVKVMLFKPFDLAKWITIGFCAWLAGLGESGGGGGGGFNNFGNGNQAHPGEEFRHYYHEANDYVMANLTWIVPAAIVLVLALLALWVFILWVSSRGKFMFLHCVALNVAEVDVPWQKFASAANSLFRFRLAMGLAGMVLMLPLVVFLAISIGGMVMHEEVDVPGVMLCVGLAMVLVCVAVVFALIHKFMVDFVVPIMFLRGGKCLAAWREFWDLLGGNPGKFTLYILFQIVLGMAIGVIVLMAIVVTCCIAGCLLALPFIGTVLMLPILVFKRAYPLYYLAQYGPQYDVFPQTASGAGGARATLAFTMKLQQGQVWQCGKEFVRIVHLKRLEVGYKSATNLKFTDGTHQHTSKKDFCRLLKGAKLITVSRPEKYSPMPPPPAT